MAGKIKELLDSIIQERSKGNPVIEEMTKAKLILKGLNPSNFHELSDDDEGILEKVYTIAEQLNVKKNVGTPINIKSAQSLKANEAEAVAELQEQLSEIDVKLVVYFAAPCYNLEKLSHLMKDAFPIAYTFGSSTAGEITSGEMLKNSIVAMGFNSNVISDAKIAVIENISKELNIEEAIQSFEKHYNESAYVMDSSRYVGIILVDGICQKEEKIMELIGDRTNLIFIGGSAGDNRAFLKTYVCANGRAYTDATVLVLLKMHENAAFSILKTQSFEALDIKLVATKVNEATREVIEFDNIPAAYAYAKAVGARAIDEVPSYFMTHPVGLSVGLDNIFIRSPLQLKGTHMQFYCNILEGMEVNLLSSTNIIQDTKEAIASKLNELGGIDGLINFHCVERTQELEKKELVKQYGQLFKDIPTIGFSTYGEEYIGHMNQTATMLAFKCFPADRISHEKQIDDITSGLIEFNILLEEEITKRTQREAEIMYLSYHDQLTGLYNRRYFEEEVLRLDKLHNLPIAVIIGDVNGLKIINDTFGHVKGDELLCKCALAMKKVCGNKHLIARIGGDEFAIVLLHSHLEEVVAMIDHIKETYEHEKINGLSLNVSFGWDIKESEIKTIHQTIKNAENDMYKNKTLENKGVRGSTIQVILKTLNEKNPQEALHSKRVSEICEKMGKAMGYSEGEVSKLRNIGLLHDIGKIAIDDTLLRMPRPLNQLEMLEVKRHPDIGYRILSSSYDLLDYATIVLSHHERYDGSGYPKGLSGEEIPKIARILAIADAFEAMTGERPFRKSMTYKEAKAEIIRCAGTQFDPELVKLFVEKVNVNEL